MSAKEGGNSMKIMNKIALLTFLSQQLYLGSQPLPHFGLKTAQAQDEFPPPPDFGDSEIPSFPSEPSANSNSSIGTSSTSNNKDTSVLNKKKRDAFNKAGAEDITDEKFPETIESFDFPNVEITDVIKAISELTGKNFIVDPGVRGKITIIAPSKITVAEAYKAFLSALAINGYTVVPSGSFLKVKNSRYAQRDNIETYSGNYYPNYDQMITRIVHLKHIVASQVQKDLRMLTSKDGDMNIYEPTNSLIISDYGSNIDRVMKIISQLDVPGFEEQLEVVPIKFAKAKDLADLIDRIVNKGGGSATNRAGSFSSTTSRFARSGSGTAGQQGSSYFMAIPDDRTNSIIVVGNQSGVSRVKKLIAQLDFRIKPEDTGGVFVYYVKHGDAEKIAQTLSGVAKDSGPKTTGGATGSLLSPMGGNPTQQASTEVFGGEVKITADKNTNSLVITASKQDYDMVLNLLSQIDIARDQVFVETVIMEMSMSDGMDYGIGYYQYDKSGYGKGGFNGGLNLQELLSPTGGSGFILPFSSSNTVEVAIPGQTAKQTIPNLVGFINLLKKNNRANILSTPQIMALDNQDAEIEVGDKIATGINTTTSATGNTASPIFEDATIKLKIKPFISPSSESIRMEITQSIKQPTSGSSAPKVIADNTQPLATRNIKTNIVINSGDTAILGGLMKDTEKETVSKVPLLGDLPIIGWLFKSKSLSKDKVNMLVFMTPKIVRNPADHQNIVTDKVEERIEFIKAQGGKDPYGQKIDKLARKNQPNKVNGNRTSQPQSQPQTKPETNDAPDVLEE